MGIRINEFDYGDDCVFCFPANFTPKFFMITFKDIKQGDLFDPALIPPPPNRIFKLTQDPVTPCHWEFKDPDFWVNLDLGVSNTALVVLDFLGGVQYFAAGPLPACTWAEQSNFTSPVGKYLYDGWYQISWIPPIGDVSLRKAVAKLGIDPDDEIWVDWYPISTTQMMIRVIRRDDHSRIWGIHDF